MMQRARLRWLVALAKTALLTGTLMATAAQADLVDHINLIRAQGCQGTAAARASLQRTAALDAVARQWASGGRLSAALAKTGYRALESASMHISGTRDDAVVASTLKKNYCEQLTQPALREIGLHRRADRVWIVVATPFSPPTVADAAKVAQQVLTLVNAARATQRRCGRQVMPPVPPLSGSAMLDRAALAHATDMAKHARFEHRGSDGSTPAVRVERQGYTWRAVGENIAAGAPDAESVVRGWLESPGHCVNIMSTDFTQMGLGYVTAAKSKSGIYWAQVLARPR